MSHEPAPFSFRDLALTEPLLEALSELGYETPTAIQRRAIPPLIDGRDALGQAQTGTGKTAAFALPLLARVDLSLRSAQVLVLTPTRELALQVSASFRQYGSKLRGLSVLPVYGGQDYGVQLRQLERGVHVVVGTPGRLMDLMRRGALALDALFALVLDEADEMLRMGFIDDVEWILEQSPEDRQTALFSATMPSAIRKIAQRHLRDPEELIAEAKTAAAISIAQSYCLVAPGQRVEALTRILEVSPHDGVIAFLATRKATLELAEQLATRGYRAAALNGDVAQRERERTVERLKRGHLDILVATDVAARGLDVERVSHVINYDLPHDAEAYVHRIGRTGRAGRSGEAILFVGPRDLRIVKLLEKATGQAIAKREMPTAAALNHRRKEAFQERITAALGARGLDPFRELLDEYRIRSGVDPLEIAAALARLLQGDTPLFAAELPRLAEPRAAAKNRGVSGPERRRRFGSGPEPGRERFRVAVGRVHGVKAGNIVGAIANEAGLSGELIGRIEINEDFSTVELPAGMPTVVFRRLKRAWVCNQPLDFSRMPTA